MGGWGRRSAVALCTSLGIGLSASAQPAGAEAASHTRSPGLSTTPVKAPITGLVDRSTLAIPPSTPPAPVPGISAYVTNVYWSQVQPSVTGPLDTSVIDQALTDIDAMRTASGTPLRLELRFFSGANTPAWLQQSNGTVLLQDSFNLGTSVPVGDYWTSAYGTAFAAVQQQLAARYDALPEIGELIAARCSHFYPEPLIKDLSIPANLQALSAAGYSEQLDWSCQQQSLAAMQPWQTTPVAATLNPYQYLHTDGTVTVEEGVTQSLMGLCVQTFNGRCVLENDSLRSDSTTFPNPTSYTQLYADMQSWADSGVPTAYQTAVMMPAGNNRVGDVWGALVRAARLRALHVELPPGYAMPPPAQQTEPWQSYVHVAGWFTGAPTLTQTNTPAVEGASATLQASFVANDTAAADTAAGYGRDGSVPYHAVTATVDWGTGPGPATVAGASQGTCAVAACSLPIAASRTVPEEASLSTVVRVFVVGGSVPPGEIAALALDTLAARCSVTDAPVRLAAARAPQARHGVRWSGVVGTVTDANPTAPAADLRAMVDWGDGSAPTTATLASAPRGGWTVSSAHTWLRSGPVTVTVSVHDDGGAAAHVAIAVRVG